MLPVRIRAKNRNPFAFEAVEFQDAEEEEDFMPISNYRSRLAFTDSSLLK